MTTSIHTLANGLTVILKEVHHAPLVSHWVAYRIGSRNERSGQTGISHWVEHMMFKGTDKFPAGMLDHAIDRVGGQWNAFTSMDYTMYFETLPADQLTLALEAEADRMVNALFDPEEVESERTVIISERQGIENRPTFWLGEQMRATAFHVHGYHHEIIGDLADLHTITRDDLYAHYQTHYAPSNAMLILVGAFDTAQILPQIEALYGTLPSRPQPKLFVRPEPPQLGERRVVVERPGKTAFVRAAYKTPPATHPDWFKLELLDSVLSGTNGLDNKSSRLYQALVQSGLAANVSGGLQNTVDPFLYTLSVTLNDGVKHEDAERALLTELERVQQEGISEAELAKAKKQARAVFAYAQESVTEQAHALAESAILGELDWADRYTERLEAVTLADVQAAAQQYLVPRQRTVGWLIPTGSEA